MCYYYFRIVGDDIVNISVDSLKSMRSSLELQYNDLETEINFLYSSKKDDIALEKIKAQDLVDKQLVLLDNIIFNLENIPKLYDELLRLNKEYKQVVGD
jgi:hypothetical protein